MLWTLASRTDKEWEEQPWRCLLGTISILMRLKRDDIRKRSRSARFMSPHSDMMLYWVSAPTVISGLANAVARTCRYRRGSAVSRGIWRSCTSPGVDSNKDSGFFHLWLLSFLASESFWNHAVGRQKKKENHESSGKYYRSKLGYYFFSRIS